VYIAVGDERRREEGKTHGRTTYAIEGEGLFLDVLITYKPMTYDLPSEHGVLPLYF